MFVKIFTHILHSTIALDRELRLVFEDMLLLADQKGYIDMPYEYIAAVTRWPEETIRAKIDLLMQPDPLSRSDAHEGRRLIPINPDRPWGWIVVNYETYRGMRTSEDKREYQRKYYHEKLKSRRINERQLKNQPSTHASTQAESREQIAESREYRNSTKSVEFLTPSGDGDDGAQSAFPYKARAKYEREKYHEHKTAFDEFWKHAWRKDDKQAGFRAYRKQLRRVGPDVLLSAVIAQSPYYLQREPDKRPYMSTWLNGERWNDELDAPAQTPKKSKLDIMMESI